MGGLGRRDGVAERRQGDGVGEVLRLNFDFTRVVINSQQ